MTIDRPGLTFLFCLLTMICSAQEKEADSGNRFRKVLDTVSIVTKKPFYEVKPDRVIVNVQSSIASAGNSVLDVLERSPGVVVNRQSGTIAMSGKDGVVIMINGKRNYMPAEAIVELLQGMSSSGVEKIELITTPPSNLDAEGHAGYINIILKKNDSYGINGSLATSLGYGDGWVDDISGNFNYRKEKLNIYGGLAHSRVEKPLPIFLNTSFSRSGNIIGSNFEVDRTEALRTVSARLGLDYQLTPKTVLGFLASAYNSKYTHHETNINRIFKNGVLDTLQKQANGEVKPWDNISINANLQHDFRQGNRISVNADYIWFKNTQPYDYYAAYYDPSGNFIKDITKRSSKYTPINFWIGSIDYSKKVSPELVLEVGAKRTIARFSNELGLERFIQGNWTVDSSYAALHKLDEDYTAFYISSDWDITKNIHARMGLRYEYTNYEFTATGKVIAEKHYGKIFPVLSITHKLNNRNSINLSWSKRIARPNFNQLTPYTYYINENTFFSGNSELQPSISNSITATWNNPKISIALGYSQEDNPIWMFQPTFDTLAGKVTFFPKNLIDQQLVTATITVPMTVNSWWTMQYNATTTWQQVKASGEDLSGTAHWNINLHAVETFRLPKNLSIELSGFYQSGQLAGVNKQASYGSLDLGIRKKLPGNKGTLTLSGTNLLNTQQFIADTQFPSVNQYTHMNVNWVQRTARITWTRSFGNDKVTAKRERATGADDAKGRVQ